MSAAAVHTPAGHTPTVLPATHTPDFDPRAYYEELLATLLEHSDPHSPHYKPELAAGYEQQALMVMETLARMDATEQIEQPATHEPPHARQSQPQPSQQPSRAPYARQQGRFTKGNPGGPGRPPKIRYVEHDMVAVVANAISPLDLHELTQVAVAKAKEGDNNAFRWLNQMLFRHCRTSVNQTAALQASGLSDEEHRLLLAEQHFGKAMEAAEGLGARGEGLGETGEGTTETQRHRATGRSEEPAAEEAPAEEGSEGMEMPANERSASETVVAEMEAAEPKGAERPTPIPAPRPLTPELPAGDVLEVRLAPGVDAPPSAVPPTPIPDPRPLTPVPPAPKNAQKRSKTVENGRNGRPVHSQVA